MQTVATGTGEAHPFIIPLTKIDVERRLVIGTAAEEIADKSSEIMDYASARPQFESWSKEFSDATGGLSKGNLRVMHTKHVAGRLDDIAYDDATKKVQIVAKVIDDNDWQKCLEGAYTGFSIGGGYLRKWKDPTGLTRYTPVVREISLVDNPCMPSAKFAELVKADGIVGQVELVGHVHTFAEAWADRPAPVPTFAETWAARPQTFGELQKAFDESKHKRDHGKFAAGDGKDEDEDEAYGKRSHTIINRAAFLGGAGAGLGLVGGLSVGRSKLVGRMAPYSQVKGAVAAIGGGLAALAGAEPARRYATRINGADERDFDPDKDNTVANAVAIPAGLAGFAGATALGFKGAAPLSTVRGAAARRAADVLRPHAPIVANTLATSFDATRQAKAKRPILHAHAMDGLTDGVRVVEGKIIPPKVKPKATGLAIRRPKVETFDPKARSAFFRNIVDTGRLGSRIWNRLSLKGKLAAGAVAGVGVSYGAANVRDTYSAFGGVPGPKLEAVGAVGDGLKVAEGAVGGAALGVYGAQRAGFGRSRVAMIGAGLAGAAGLGGLTASNVLDGRKDRAEERQKRLRLSAAKAGNP